jgi:hypothetical protein
VDRRQFVESIVRAADLMDGWTEVRIEETSSTWIAWRDGALWATANKTKRVIHYYP